MARRRWSSRSRRSSRSRSWGSRSGATTARRRRTSTRSWSSTRATAWSSRSEGCRRRRHWTSSSTRMDEAADTIDDTAGDLDDAGAPSDLADPHERLVEQLGQLAADIQGTADQARIPGYEDILQGAAGLNFESWDEINAILAELRETGHRGRAPRPSDDQLTEFSRRRPTRVMRRISPIVLVACALAGVWGLTGSIRGWIRATRRYPTSRSGARAPTYASVPT